MIFLEELRCSCAGLVVHRWRKHHAVSAQLPPWFGPDIGKMELRGCARGLPALHANPATAIAPAEDALAEARLFERVTLILNEVAPFNLNRTVNRIMELPIASKSDLESVVRAIMGAIFRVCGKEYSSEQSCCVETYADIAAALNSTAPNFESDTCRRTTFNIVLLTDLQSEFETLHLTVTAAESDNVVVSHLMGVMAYIGHVFARGLMARSTIELIVSNLIGNATPMELSVHAACVLVHCAGRSLTASGHGTLAMNRFCDVLAYLKRKKIYGDDLQAAIQTVFSAREQNWPARAGSLILVQYHVVSKSEAIQVWAELSEQDNLPLGLKAFAEPPDVGEACQYLRVSSVLSGQSVAVVSPHSVEMLHEHTLKEEICAAMAIHANRVVVLKPDGSVLDSLVGQAEGF